MTAAVGAQRLSVMKESKEQTICTRDLSDSVGEDTSLVTYVSRSQSSLSRGISTRGSGTTYFGSAAFFLAHIKCRFSRLMLPLK